jgi:hypothetical protein
MASNPIEEIVNFFSGKKAKPISSKPKKDFWGAANDTAKGFSNSQGGGSLRPYNGGASSSTANSSADAYSNIPNELGDADRAFSHARRAAQQQALERQVANQPAPTPPNLTDFLQQALGMLGNGGRVDTSAYDQEAASLQQNGQQAGAALSKAYADLVARYAADLPGIQQNYDQAGATIQANAAAAQQDNNAAYGAAQTAQGDVLKNLGIQDAQANIIERGNDSHDDQAHQNANIVAGRTANLDLNALQKQIATQYNTQAGQAQGVAGAQQQAMLQQNLAKQLAAISAQKAQYQQSAIGNNFSQALQLANGMSQDYWNQQDRASSNDLAAQKLLLQQQSAQQKSGRSGSIIDMLNKYIQQTGQQVDPKTYAALLNAFANAS